jgi:hypothetical protein
MSVTPLVKRTIFLSSTPPASPSSSRTDGREYRRHANKKTRGHALEHLTLYAISRVKFHRFGFCKKKKDEDAG